MYYVGDKIPQLKNKFLVAAYNGDIYALTLDLQNKQIIKQEHIALKHYPFEPVTSIAQSPSGDIYYGGYHIYKLDSVNVDNKRQDIFPVEIKSPSNMDIQSLQASTIGDKNVIDVYASTNKSQSSSSLSSSVPLSLQMSIPRGIIEDVSSVTTTIISGQARQQQPSIAPTTAVNFAIDDNSSSSDTKITIHLRSGVYYPQLSVKGITTVNNVDNPKGNNNNNTMVTGENNKAAMKSHVAYDPPFVSIVKFASDASTLKPYLPSPLNIAAATTVKWTNNDSVPHTVTEGAAATNYSPMNKFDSGILAPGQTFDHNFDRSGIVRYFCTIHPFMSGEVIVK